MGKKWRRRRGRCEAGLFLTAQFNVAQGGWCERSGWEGGGDNWVKKETEFFLLLSPLAVGERLRNKVDEYFYFLHPLISRDFRGQEAWGEQGVFPSINI